MGKVVRTSQEDPKKARSWMNYLYTDELAMPMCFNSNMELELFSKN